MGCQSLLKLTVLRECAGHGSEMVNPGSGHHTEWRAWGTQGNYNSQDRVSKRRVAQRKNFGDTRGFPLII